MVSANSLWLLFSIAIQAGAAPTCNDYGSWYVEVVLAGGAQGDRQGDIYTTHSKTPQTTNHARWYYNPRVDNTTYTQDDPTLNVTWVRVLGTQTFEIQQAVLGTPLKGSGPLTMYFNPNSNGRGGIGNTTITSELDV
ncbi:uncharacterized protein CTRU02_213086 [Colletotrichum truncatum]|uniref:Uncharacterized protein n=1 Tax=Colletotrichum truncatum TaxID=5467 RepID=A0ACC3YJP2_COLTU|nr:uncharacterized protein CTRU02_03408 [Colletotrichum truncatum]KAF6797377.1 hypothetical protein CTRU02_03408 [Colletotrichum truncatum]